MDYLNIDDLLVAAAAFLGHEPVVRDYGLLESALARPRATVFGEDAYPDIHQKAAALLISLVGNHALVDGNKRLGWLGLNMFYGLNGYGIRADLDAAYDLIMAIAAGSSDMTVPEVAGNLRAWVDGGQ